MLFNLINIDKSGFITKKQYTGFLRVTSSLPYEDIVEDIARCSWQSLKAVTNSKRLSIQDFKIFICEEEVFELMTLPI